MELVLKAGDLLYLPRGTIHKGEAVEGEASHHLTISTYQKLLGWSNNMRKKIPSPQVGSYRNWRISLPKLRPFGHII